MKLKRAVVIAWAMLGLKPFPALFVAIGMGLCVATIVGTCRAGVWGCVTWLRDGQ